MSQLEQAEPLNEREKALLSRLLADPQNYPQALKTWIVGYVEGSEIDLPMEAVHGLLDQLGKLKNVRDFTLAAGQGFRVLDATGAAVFVIDEDGDVHGKTGKALIFDL